VAGSCEHNNEPSGSSKGEKFLNWLRDYQRVPFGIKEGHNFIRLFRLDGMNSFLQHSRSGTVQQVICCRYRHAYYGLYCYFWSV